MSHSQVVVAKLPLGSVQSYLNLAFMEGALRKSTVLHPAGFPLLTAPNLLCRAQVAFPFAKSYASFTLFVPLDLFAASATVQQLFIFSLNYLLSLVSCFFCFLYG